VIFLYNIFISPGHGGTDSGAIGIDAYEKDINLSVSLYLHEMLIKNGNFNVVMARNTDKTVQLFERALMENEIKHDLCICIHHNAVNGNAFGAEVIHSVNGGPGKYLAELIAEEFKKNGQFIRRVFSEESKVYRGKDKLYMIRYTKAPCVITEYCFIDNKTDILYVNDGTKRKAEATAIFRAICRYFGLSVEEELDYKSLYENEAQRIAVLEGKLEVLNKSLMDIVNFIMK